MEGEEEMEKDGDGDRRLIKWEDTAANITLGTETNYPLAYDPGLKTHHPIMSTLGSHKVQLDREIPAPQNLWSS